MAGDTRVQVFIIYSIHIVCFLQEWGVPINMGMLISNIKQTIHTELDDFVIQ